jgi:hypothetical protein
MNAARIYTQGLRQEDTLRSSGAGQDWQRVVFHRLRLEYTKLARGPKTEASEDGLDMEPSAYWYVARLEQEFAYVATLSADVLNPGGSGMACAFDTGGLWHGHLKLAAPLDAAQKRQFLAEHAYSMDEYEPVMMSWLEAAYPPEPLVHYSRGIEPTVHTIGEVVITDSRSWTWEVSVAVTAPTDSFPRATSLHMTEQQYDQYESWVSSRRELSNSEVYNHVKFVEGIIHKSDDPYKDATELLIASVT